MKKVDDVHKGDYRSFVHCSEAYYHKALGFSGDTVDEVYFGLSCGGGGTHGEMVMNWSPLGGKNVPQLRVFDDGWPILASFPDLLKELATVGAESISDVSITPKEFCEILIRCGFKDDTQREDPRPAESKSHTPDRAELEKALQSIANLWPVETSAKISSVSGINDGRSRAILAESAVTIARNALGIEKLP
jgi:hypothetical protein